MRLPPTPFKGSNSSRYRRDMRYFRFFISFRACGLLALLVTGSLTPVWGQEKMLENYSAMPDLRCTAGFLEVDGWWSTDRNRLAMERVPRWANIFMIHDVLPVAGAQVGPDEPGFRLSSRAAGVGAPVAQYKVHLIQDAAVFLAFLEKCKSGEPLHLARLGPSGSWPVTKIDPLFVSGGKGGKE